MPFSDPSFQYHACDRWLVVVLDQFWLLLHSSLSLLACLRLDLVLGGAFAGFGAGWSGSCATSATLGASLALFNVGVYLTLWHRTSHLTST